MLKCPKLVGVILVIKSYQHKVPLIVPIFLPGSYVLLHCNLDRKLEKRRKVEFLYKKGLQASKNSKFMCFRAVSSQLPSDLLYFVVEA